MEKAVIGRWLETKRKGAGLSKYRLAKKAGLSHVYVMQLERGDNMPSLDVMDRILSALGVPWHEFLEETGYVKKTHRGGRKTR